MMKRWISKTLLMLGMFLGILWVSGYETYAGSTSSWDEFREVLQKVHQRIHVANQKRPFKLKYLNDSLEETAMASSLMLQSSSTDEILRHLTKARQSYQENYYAILLEAIVFDVSGNKKKADERFEEFLIKSTTFTNFESLFITWKEFYQLRRGVYYMLRARGISLSRQDMRIQEKRRFKELMHYLLHPAPQDKWMNMIFIFVLLLGGGALALASLLGVDFSRPASRSFLGMYLVFGVAYGIWLVDLAIGLPFGGNRFSVIPLFLTFFLVGFILYEIVDIWKERWRPLEKGYKRCPYCREVIVTLMTECPKCHRRIES